MQGKKLTSKQREKILSVPKSHFYIIYGSVTKKWWVQFSDLDKFTGGFNSEEEAKMFLENNYHLNESTLWETGNKLIL